MKFTALNEKEIFEKNLLRGGIYPFLIEDAHDDTSSAGNEMIVLEIRVLANGQSKILRDYLVPKGKGMMKLRHAAEYCGLLEKYETGILSGDDFVAKRGRCRVGLERDRSGKYGPKNVVLDYVA